MGLRVGNKMSKKTINYWTEAEQIKVLSKYPNDIAQIIAPSEAVQLAVIRNNPNLIRFIENTSDEAIKLALELNPDLLSYLYSCYVDQKECGEEEMSIKTDLVYRSIILYMKLNDIPIEIKPEQGLGPVDHSAVWLASLVITFIIVVIIALAFVGLGFLVNAMK